MRLNMVNVISVFVIILFIILGVYVVRSLNEDFFNRQVSTEMQKYKYSSLAFLNNYEYLPGDLPNASFYWGEDKIADGNGDGIISREEQENFYAWDHLKMSDLINIEGKRIVYLKQKNAKDEFSNDEHKPYLLSSAYEGTVYSLEYDDKNNGNMLKIYSYDEETGELSYGLTATEAFDIDLLIDDGYPLSGSIRAFSQSEGKCFFKGEYKREYYLKECIIGLYITE